MGDIYRNSELTLVAGYSGKEGIVQKQGAGLIYRYTSGPTELSRMQIIGDINGRKYI